MKKQILMVAASVVAFCACAQILNTKQSTEPFWLGADISGTTHWESQGVFTYDTLGNKTETTRLMKDYGLNGVRLRVWVNPEGGWSSPEDVLEMARRAWDNDMAIMIDFHYSDWWADPAKQNIPAAWKDYDYEQMKKAVADHTRSTLKLLRDNGIDVKWVQVGNETTNGFLWPMGHMDNIAQYAGLTNAGYDAVKEIYPDAEVIVHIDNGYDADLYDYVFDGLKANGGKWDMIGMSLYPYWASQNDPNLTEDVILRQCVDNINRLANKYGCDTMIVETGVEASKPEEGKEFIARLLEAASTETNGHCKGVWYWAPETCHGGYPLGAFQDDKPTIIMDAFLEFEQ